MTIENKIETLKLAKKLYIDEEMRGLCTALYMACEMMRHKLKFKDNLRTTEIYHMFNLSLINPFYMSTERVVGGYWWKLSDRMSRITAFNKLINHFEIVLYVYS